MIKPTCEEIWVNVGFTKVASESDTSWRHGSYESDIYLREEDGTFWMVSYRLSNDCETNELRDGEAGISQVRPKEVTTTIYEPVGD